MTGARQAAFKVLCKMQGRSSYSNLALSEMADSKALGDADRALAHRVVKTVLERQLTADYNLSLYLRQPLSRLNPRVLTILRMGACQLLFMDRLPESAVVNESVALAKKNGLAFASGLINAVLRKIAVNGLRLPEGGIEKLAMEYSYPESTAAALIDYYGFEAAEKIMAASLEPSRIYIRKNTLKAQALTVGSEECDFPPDCRILTQTAGIKDCDDYKNGLFHVQDRSSQICCMLLDAQKGQRVLDVCASPGGKSLTAAQYVGETGSVVACDIYKHKLALISDSAKRLGIDNITVLERDGALDKTDIGLFDRIICDVPCSGLGVASKKPEIKYTAEQRSGELSVLALQILENSAERLKKGGRLVYSTCTLLPRENALVVSEFLKRRSDFSVAEISGGVRGFRDGGTLTVLPFDYDCDGFFIAVLERNE